MTHQLKFPFFIPLLALAVAGCTQNGPAANDSGIHYTKKDNADQAVAAKFNGKDITMEELEKSSPEIYAARLGVYKAQKNALDDFVRNSVIEDMAKKASLSNEEFTKKEMESAKKKISDKEVEAFLKARNVPDTSKVPPEVRDQVRGLLHMQKLVANATKGNSVELYLKRPRAAPIEFKTEGDPMWGNADAPITIIEYADFQCYYCGKAKPTLAELKKTYGKKLRIIYKHYPLPGHAEARPAAEASMCVNEQGSDKFWKFHDALYDNQKAWTKDDFKEFAKKAGVSDMKKFEECYDGKKYAEHINTTMAEAQKLGVNSTPSFFVNSHLVQGAQDVGEFREIIDESLN